MSADWRVWSRRFHRAHEATEKWEYLVAHGGRNYLDGLRESRRIELHAAKAMVEAMETHLAQAQKSDDDLWVETWMAHGRRRMDAIRSLQVDPVARARWLRDLRQAA